MTGREWAAVSRNGFAVLRRAGYASPYEAYKDIYRMELPLFVTADSILHAVFRSHEVVVREVEAPLLDAVGASLTAMHGALPAARASLPDDAVRDLDLYLAVVRSLAAGEAIAPLDESLRAQAARLVEAVTGAAEIDESVALFGRTRVIDFTAYAPRGPYADDPARQRWFRVARWLSRLEFNVVSRDCRSSQPGITPVPAETPRQALDAFALAELAGRAGELERIRNIADLWGALAGRREDLGLDDLKRVREQSGVGSLRDPDAFERLARAVGDGFQRTARTHPMPQGVRVMPAIATVLGPRVVADAAMTRPLVLDASREGDDLYSRWLESLRALARPTAGVRPSFMGTRAWDDFRMNTLVVGYGQLRHGNVLVAAESYDGAACRIPDAWVEPAPELYRALRRYVEVLGGIVTGARGLARERAAELERWLDETDRVLRGLQRIAQDELAGHALTEAQRLFLGYVAEVLTSTGGSPTHTGWYLDLFPELDAAMASADFIADWYASVNDNSVSYVGASGIALGVFVVDRGGAPRLMVGPVAEGYEHHGPLARRINDAEARQLAPDDRRAPWSRSYAVEPAPAPTFAFRYDEASAAGDPPPGVAARYTVEGGATPGLLVVEMLSSHRRVLARGQVTTGARPANLVVRWLPGVRPPPRGEECERSSVRAVRLRHGDWVVTARTDEYPHADSCSMPSLEGNSYGAAPESEAAAGAPTASRNPRPPAHRPHDPSPHRHHLRAARTPTVTPHPPLSGRQSLAGRSGAPSRQLRGEVADSGARGVVSLRIADCEEARR